MTGKDSSRGLGDGLEFADHRAYTPGDDVRFLDWPYYARQEKLLLRLFHRHGESDTAVLLDASASMMAGGAEKFDHARRVTAALAYLAMAGGRRVLVQPFDEELRPAMRSARDRRRIFPLLDFLAGLSAGGKTAIARIARDFGGQAKNVGIVFLVSDLLDVGGEWHSALRSLSSVRRDVVVLHVFSRFPDADGPSGEIVCLRHAETGHTLPVDLTPAVRERYRAAWRAYCDEIEHACRLHRAAYVPMPSEVPLERLLPSLLQAGLLRGMD